MDTSAVHAAPGLAAALGEPELREIADAAPVILRRARPDGRCDWFNKPWLDFTGRAPECELGFGWAEGVHPEDRARCLAAFAEPEPFTMDYRLRRHDGAYRWIVGSGAPIRRDGELVGFVASGIDVTCRREREVRRELLVNELNHRVRNTLTIVQSVAAQTFRDETDVARGAKAFQDRLVALSSAHNLLTQEVWEPVLLHKVVEAAAAASIGSPDIGCWCRLDGPEVRLRPQSAVAMAMAVHELCTNALKYGALLAEAGRVTIRWRLTDEACPKLHFLWKEEGGPAVVAPSRRGFGTRMLERGLAGELGGVIRMHFDPDGLRCEVETPRDRLQ